MSNRDLRALLGGALAIVCFILVPRAARSFHASNAASVSTLTHLRQQRTDFERAEAAYPVVRDSLRARTQRLAAMDSLFVEGADAFELSANFAEMLGEAARSVGATLSPIRVDWDSAKTKGVQAKQRTEFQVMRTRVSISGRSDAVFAFIEWLEGTPPLLVLDDITVTSRTANASAADSQLQASFVVSGLALRRLNRSDKKLTSVEGARGL